MKHLYNYLASKNITVKDFEDKACIVLDNNEGFIPFAKNDLMAEYNLSSECTIEVNMLLARLLERYYTFAKKI